MNHNRRTAKVLLLAALGVFARRAKSGRLTALGITELILSAGWIALAVYSFNGGMSV